MSQTTLTSFFNSRKRAATDDIVTSKNKVPHIERSQQDATKFSRKSQLIKKIEFTNNELKQVASIPSVIECVKKSELCVTPIENVSKKETVSEQPVQEQAVFGKKSNANNVTKGSKSLVTNSARQELSLGDIRKRLAGSSRLAELKATADRLSKGIHQLKEASDKRNLKEFKSIDVEVPSR